MTAGFAERLRKLRADKGISQQLAVKMMVDRSSIARWENGTRSPDITLMPVCRSAVDVFNLLNEDGRSHVTPPGHSGFFDSISQNTPLSTRIIAQAEPSKEGSSSAAVAGTR